MPLPLILAGAAVVAAIGVAASVKSKIDNDEASDINENAQKIYDEATENLDRCRKSVNSKLVKLGETKLALKKEVFPPFIGTFSRIKNVDYAGMELPEEFPPDISQDILAIRDITISMEEAVGGTAGALGAGALAGLAAYGSVGLLGTASTGAAISGLSGVAATNATLAWLGGGALSAGGMGIAGGTAVLGGIAVAPVLLVGGLLLASQAAKAKEDARSNLANAEAAAEAMQTAEEVVRAIGRVTNQTRRVVLDLREHLDRDLAELQAVVKGNEDYRTYSRREKELVARTVSLAVTAKTVAETPLLEEDGAVTQTIGDTLRNAGAFLKQIKEE